ncbi:MAG: pyridoxamine 5'-phosphate oxidase family protein [Candidatus Marinimicrobia bacterium]|jgi:hypothetical protein|nr:flavin-nucleotide-binding protein [Candidatus Neomarinimicrobiota bacterium]MDP6456992.1 pyridoxamine 5'-phosphate oxidase family protein [Candidatus Neomarinimicrobiota bacterium]MDP6594005.1 pyridoxamine 5'-phosphate oxidase family protein [Candidatus Neomarinimicrobiota bacterium]MDP6836840.1 pyridoxamine 5'-phosphate oxidase family protein [Candidatus Neomarinimicrobiota bacterium]
MEFPKTKLNRIRRHPNRGVYDRDALYEIIDEAPICHVGIAEERQPVVIPTIHARIGDNLILHGSFASRLLDYVCSGKPLCVTITIVDGVVLARALYNHSMNYRSVVIFGTGELVEDHKARMAAMKAISDHLLPGRWEDARRPNDKELKVTKVVSIPITEASAKVRSGPPEDQEDDYELPVWAGVIPLSLQASQPVTDPQLREHISVPEYLSQYGSSK